MDKIMAERLGSYALDAGLDACILTLGRGDEFCVRISNPQWHCWSFADWNEFCKMQKHKREQQRRERSAIDPAEPYSLRAPVAV